MNGFTVKLCPPKPPDKMKTNGHSRKCAAEQGIVEALKKVIEEKSREFTEKDSKLYAQA